MKKYKCFVSYINHEGKRVWKVFREDSVWAATRRVDMIADNNRQVSYVRIEHV